MKEKEVKINWNHAATGRIIPSAVETRLFGFVTICTANRDQIYLSSSPSVDGHVALPIPSRAPRNRYPARFNNVSVRH